MGAMSPLAAVLVVLVPAYLLGGFPSALMMARAGGHDVLHEGSGNPGASNVARLMGWRAGLSVLAMDAGKGALAAGVGYAMDGRAGAYALGVAAVLGHVAPALRRFRGGKGVATAAGMLVVLYPLVVLGLAVVWVIVARVLRMTSVGSILVTVAFPVVAGLLDYPAPEVAALSVLAALVVVRHASNIRRLVHGRELHVDGQARGAVNPDGPGADAPSDG